MDAGLIGLAAGFMLGILVGVGFGWMLPNDRQEYGQGYQQGLDDLRGLQTGSRPVRWKFQDSGAWLSPEEAARRTGQWSGQWPAVHAAQAPEPYMLMAGDDEANG